MAKAVKERAPVPTGVAEGGGATPVATPIKDQAAELAWLQRRQGGIGSSDAPVLVLGRVYDRTPLDTYLSKVEPIAPRTEESPDLRRGHTYEGLAAALVEHQLGVRIHRPETDDERYGTYQVWHPARPYLYADLDGMCDDGWVLEIKSPRQMRASRIRTDGAPDYYQVQCQHLALVADAAERLPGVGAAWRGRIKGTRLVIYEPENVDIIVIELPIDREMGELLAATCHRFWHEHVEQRVPPIPPPRAPRQAKALDLPPKGGEYVAVGGEAWEQVAATFLVADQLHRTAKRRIEAAKETIKEVLAAAQVGKVRLPSGLKFSYQQQPGRKTLDRKRLAQEHPELDLSAYEEQGDPSMVFRSYGAGDKEGGGSLDEGIVSLRDELAAFPLRDLDVEIALDMWEELRGQAEMYQRMLANEAGEIAASIEAASEAVVNRFTTR